MNMSRIRSPCTCSALAKADPSSPNSVSGHFGFHWVYSATGIAIWRVNMFLLLSLPCANRTKPVRNHGYLSLAGFGTIEATN